MIGLIDLLVSVYSLGLIVYLILCWMRNTQTQKAREWLAHFYDPILGKIRAIAKPLRVGNHWLDIAPVILLFGLMVLKRLVVYLLPRGL